MFRLYRIFLLIQLYKNPGQNIEKFYDSFDSPKATPDRSEQLWDLPSYPVSDGHIDVASIQPILPGSKESRM